MNSLFKKNLIEFLVLGVVLLSLTSFFLLNPSSAYTLTISAPASAAFPTSTVSTLSQISTTTISYIEVNNDLTAAWNATIKSTHFTVIGPVYTLIGSNNTVGTSGKYDGTYLVTDPVKRYGVKIIDGGAVGTATYQWRVDDGTWSATATTSAEVALEKGINVTFGAATYVVGDEWAFGVDVFPYTSLYVTPGPITVVSGGTGVTAGTAEYLTGTAVTSDDKTIMSGAAGTSTGIYRQDEDLELTIHPNCLFGNYSATLTFTVL